MYSTNNLHRIDMTHMNVIMNIIIGTYLLTLSKMNIVDPTCLPQYIHALCKRETK